MRAIALVLLTVTLVGPAAAQGLRQPAPSLGEQENQALRGITRSEQLRRSDQQQNQFELNQLRQENSRQLNTPALTGPGSVGPGCRPGLGGC